MDKWTKLERECGISFRKPNGEFKPVNEWLDDLYLQFTSAQIYTIIEHIFGQAELLFDDQTKLRTK